MPAGDRPPRLRPVVRALMVAPDGAVLLVRLVHPHGSWWVLPGGGIEEGEGAREALIRELREETGLVDPDIGPCVWRRTIFFDFWPDWDGQHEQVHLVRCDRFVPEPLHGARHLAETEHVHEVRWWSPTELASPGDPDSGRLSPANLAELVRDIIDHGPPAEPPELLG
jgi:8-oxo-dGTP pyrophosphatase MutT (NUDIX family)